MLLLYLKIAFRMMWKYKTQSFIGILGLAFGLACFVPALYWLRYETSYDCFYPEAENIYRVYSFDRQNGHTKDRVSGILERKLHDRFPAMQTSTVFFVEPMEYKTERMPYVQLQTLFTDSAFLQVFPQTVIGGDRRQPLQAANQAVLTETAAVRLFGGVEKAVGQSLKSIGLTQYDPPYTVTAVVKDPPNDTNVPFDLLLSHEQIKAHKTFVDQSGQAIWNFASLQMYAKLPPYTDVGRLARQLKEFPARQLAKATVEIRMLPIAQVRYQLNADAPFTLNFIRLFVIVGLLLLCSALFNFLNLQRDLFRQRMREFNLRAVHGASGSQLLRQMMFELACAILLVFVPACGLVLLVVPAFAGLLDMTMKTSQALGLFALCALGTGIFVGAAGFILFRRLARQALRPQAKRKPTGPLGFQRLAVALQFAVSMVFIVAAGVVLLQMRFVNHKDLGFDREGVVHLEGLQLFMNEDIRAALMKELASIPLIEKITDTYFTPKHSPASSDLHAEVEWAGKPRAENTAFYTVPADSRFAETFKLHTLAGKWLDEGAERQIVLNEEAVRVMGLDEPVGTVVRLSFLEDKPKCRVVGVVADFHLFSFRSRMYPTIFFISAYPTNSLYLRVVPGKEQEVVQRLNALLPHIDPSLASVHPVALGEMYDRLNYSEQAGLKMFSVLATVCLLLSLFGIYGVATAQTQRRRKEIAIRKVMGAEASRVVCLFFREYACLVAVAGAVALPLAFMAMNNWLEGYAYRTQIPGWLLGGVPAGVIGLAWLTVGRQVWKAANGNPAQVVKSD